MQTTRRTFLAGTAGLAAATGLGMPAIAQSRTAVRFTLDWRYQAPHAIFYLAREKGYFREEGLDVTIDQGEGSAATITRIMGGAYDAGFGDMTAIIQQASARPGDQPVMTYMIYNRAPFAVLVKGDGPIKDVKDLAGKKFAGAPGSSATRFYPVFARLNGLDPTKNEMVSIAPNLQEQMVIQGQVDGAMVFTLTSYMNLVGMRQNPDRDFRFIVFADHGVEAYSNGVMVSQKLVKDNPAAVAGLTRATNKAMKDMIASPAPGIKLLLGIEPTLKEDVELQRWVFAHRSVIATPEAVRLGAGDVDDARMTRAIAQAAEAFSLTNLPAPAAVFNRSFLPPIADRRMEAPRA